MNLKVQNIYAILKCVFLYLLLCVAIKSDLLTLSKNADLKMRQKNIKNGPIYTYVKTDKHANIKWGVRHYIPRAIK